MTEIRPSPYPPRRSPMSRDKKKTPQEDAVERPFPASFLPSLFPSIMGQGADLGPLRGLCGVGCWKRAPGRWKRA